jgi:hypothetical protein
MTARQRPRRSGYRITHLCAPTAERNYFRLTVPPALAARVPEGAIFDLEITEDGLLFWIRPDSVADAGGKKPPSWSVG